MSLGETMREVHGKECQARPLSPDMINYFFWHMAHLEFGHAAEDLCKLSLMHAEQDQVTKFKDPDDYILAGGNATLVHALEKDLPICYCHSVKRITYGDAKVEVVAAVREDRGHGGACTKERGEGQPVTGGQRAVQERRYIADAVIVTVPLGVLKKGSAEAGGIDFSPPLPMKKQVSIRRLGFGLLNKCIMLFPHQFWQDGVSFGSMNEEEDDRGLLFMFYSYAEVAGAPVLLGLISGKSAQDLERHSQSKEDKARAHKSMCDVMMKKLRSIFKDMDVPDPLQSHVTNWGSDPFALGSYSNVAVGATGEDYDSIAEPTGGNLFFAGEHTCRSYPASMHGAFLSGLRAAGWLHTMLNDGVVDTIPPTHPQAMHEKEHKRNRNHDHNQGKGWREESMEAAVEEEGGEGEAEDAAVKKFCVDYCAQHNIEPREGTTLWAHNETLIMWASRQNFSQGDIDHALNIHWLIVSAWER